jgi:hypothetical protein
MKIEIGESLFYSWLRHVKQCQIVQTNWKSSPVLEALNIDIIDLFMHDVALSFKPDHDIFGKQSSSQLLRQSEIDVLGLALNPEVIEDISVFAIDVAFHESGLNYGDKGETVLRVIKKCARTAMCLLAYFGVTKGEIIFASPKINPAVLTPIQISLEQLNNILSKYEKLRGLKVRLIANDEFHHSVLRPILEVSAEIADTSELFMRSYQLVQLFGGYLPPSLPIGSDTPDVSVRAELKVGALANTVFRRVLETGIDEIELRDLQDAHHSKQVFGIYYPLLTSANIDFPRERYYVKPLTINHKQFYLCSQWVESNRPKLEDWLKRHQSHVGT